MKTKIVTAALSVLTMAGLTFIWGNATFAAGQTCLWTGGGGNALFSDAANWSGCTSSGVPEDGDIVSFDQTSFGGQTELALTNDVSSDLAGVSVVNGGGGSLYLYLSEITLATNGTVMSGNGGYLKIGTPGAGSDPDTLGDLNVNGDYTLTDDMVQGLDYNSLKVQGKLIVGSGYTFGVPSLNLANDTFGSIEISRSVQFITNTSTMTVSSPMVMNDGANPRFFAPYDAEPSDWTLNLTGAVTVNAVNPVDVVVGNELKVIFSGSGADAAKIKRSGVSTGELVIGGVTQETASKTTDLTGESPSTNVIVGDNETAIMAEGSTRGSVAVYAGGVLKGIGTVTNGISVMPNATIAPGMSPGCLTTASLYIGGSYEFEIGGNDACSGYDQLKVTGPTGDTVFLDDESAVLNTSRWNNFTPAQGKVFTIIDNQGPNAVVETFKNLPEGATFSQNGVVFKISYVGGNGNDVTLTVMNQPTAPNTGFELVKANPVVTAAVAFTASIALLVIARRLQMQR